MNNITNKTFTLSILTCIVIIGAFLFFTSATTVEQSNSESINDLFNKVEQMNQDLDKIEMHEVSEMIPDNHFLGEVALFAGDYPPEGWEFCNGQLLNISTNSSLHSLLGATYGGDGRMTMGLPNLEGKLVVHSGRDQKYPLGKIGRVKSKMMSHDPKLLDHDIDLEGMEGYQVVNYIICVGRESIYPARN